ncbi:Hypothetical protein SRAE_2000050700 [Strongyloides ratti]|uniref:Uncharacterized protein n=1 Tax=Strongyloides ratti TaxID=34506 RepID=A0A090L7W6_STRRB|nr:Hypothetical protein SRAE_2000050700 [Strongyloides ratti]CEF65832.1 Hypothetical protein SRAE_2000050700 [Strongyloides ratti]
MNFFSFIILTIFLCNYFLDAVVGVIKGEICDGDACIAKGMKEKTMCWCVQKEIWRKGKFIESECICFGGLG